MMIGSSGASFYVRPQNRHSTAHSLPNAEFNLTPTCCQIKWHDNLYFKSLANPWIGNGPVGPGQARGEQAGKGLSGFEILPRPLCRKKYQYKMT